MAILRARHLNPRCLRSCASAFSIFGRAAAPLPSSGIQFPGHTDVRKPHQGGQPLFVLVPASVADFVIAKDPLHPTEGILRLGSHGGLLLFVLVDRAGFVQLAAAPKPQGILPVLLQVPQGGLQPTFPRTVSSAPCSR